MEKSPGWSCFGGLSQGSASRGLEDAHKLDQLYSKRESSFATSSSSI